MSSLLKKQISEKVNRSLDQGVMTACQIKVVQGGKVFYEGKFGKDYRYFDLASVTKGIFTTPLIIELVEKKKLDLNSRVEKYLPGFKGHDVGKIQIRSLLDQTSGLQWWRPFYKKLNKIPVSQREGELKKLFLKEKAKKSATCVYSDLGFIVLGWIIEEIYQLPLDLVFKKTLAKKLKLKNTFFIRHFKTRKNKNLFAPTEKTKDRGIVQGEVHDDNCWSWGGVSGHTGLFSTLKETSQLAEMLRKNYNSGSKTFKKFAQRAVSKKKGDWGLGFYIPSRPLSTGGTLISTESFGFPGFTGTSIWVDTKRDVTVTILSNWTFPHIKNIRLRRVIRAELHDMIWEALDGR